MNHSDVSTDAATYRHRQEYGVRYDDLDTYRHVNNKAFLTWIEDARVRYLIDAAGFRHHTSEDEGVMVVHAAIDYRSQVHAFETVTVHTRCARIGGRSITLHHLVTASGEDGTARTAATSTTVMAAVDLTANTSMAVPDAVVDHIVGWEPTPPERTVGSRGAGS